MNNGQMVVVMKIQPSICLDDWGKPKKKPVRLVGTGIRTRDLPNASLVRYQGITLFYFKQHMDVHQSWRKYSA